MVPGGARPLGKLPPRQVPHYVKHDQRGEKDDNRDVDDVTVAKHGAPVIAQGEAAPGEECVPGACPDHGEETERHEGHASHARRVSRSGGGRWE